MRRLLAVLVILLVVTGIAALAYAWEAAIASIDPPARGTFDQATIARGERLAAIGNCSTCHTRPGGKAYAGGLALNTPFGTIHSTNITPDPETGIGRWSFEAFTRSMRRGVDREGRHLYPAFPYDHFTLVTDEDNRALYAFLMTRDPVSEGAHANQLRFPLNYRMLIAGWKLLYLREGPYRPDAAQSAEWNHGAYLAQGLGHCGACHTPRNALGAERRDLAFAGGEAEGWVAYAINAQSPAPVPWTAESLQFYLRNGWHSQHGVSRGPMAQVTTNLGVVPESDLRAVALYVADQMKGATPKQGKPVTPRAGEHQKAGTNPASGDSQATVPAGAGAGPGEAIYAGACAGCHDSGRAQPYGGLDLRLSTAVHAPDPTNIVNVVLYGLPPAEGERSPIMPGFGAVMSDAQLEGLLAYLRSAFTTEAPWSNLAALIARQRTSAVALHATDGALPAPAQPNQRVTAHGEIERQRP
jgi:mono/diheme cytochrome c family protein